ncbi:hypothetical protein J6590_005201 [Homalodisca vitripennis]|nr:hypothetical protein J6590_005201 [Homalodisca vitripennis]
MRYSTLWHRCTVSSDRYWGPPRSSTGTSAVPRNLLSTTLAKTPPYGAALTHRLSYYLIRSSGAVTGTTAGPCADVVMWGPETISQLQQPETAKSCSINHPSPLSPIARTRTSTRACSARSPVSDNRQIAFLY